MKRTWPRRTGWSTPPGTARSTDDRSPRSPTPPGQPPTASGAPRPAGLQRAHRRGRRDRLPAPGGNPHLRFGLNGPPATTATGLRSRASAGHTTCLSLLPARIHHRRRLRTRRAVRERQRPGRHPSANLRSSRRRRTSRRATPSTARLDLAQAYAGWADKLYAHPWRLPGVGRTVGVAQRRRWRALARPAQSRPAPVSELELSEARTRSRWPSMRTGPGPDPDQVPGPGPAPVRPGTGRGRRPARRPAGRALRSEFEPVACLQVPKPAQAPGQPAARADGRSVYRAHVPAGRRHACATVPQSRMLGACALDRSATHGPRRRRAGARRGTAQLEAALADARQTRKTRKASARAPDCARTRPPPRWRYSPTDGEAFSYETQALPDPARPGSWPQPASTGPQPDSAAASSASDRSS